MPEDWDEICSQLGKPIILSSHHHSYTKHCRAYWTNIKVPEDFKDDYPPLDPDTCMDAGHKVQRYMVSHEECTRPLGAKWSGDPESPVADTGKPILVIDEKHQELQHI